MNENKNNNSNYVILTESGQHKTLKNKLLNYSAQNNSTSNCTPPSFQAEEKRKTNIILSNEKAKNNKE